MTVLVQKPPPAPVPRATITITLSPDGDLNVQSNINDVFARVGVLQAAIHLTLTQASAGRIVRP